MKSRLVTRTLQVNHEPYRKPRNMIGLILKTNLKSMFFSDKNWLSVTLKLSIRLRNLVLELMILRILVGIQLLMYFRLKRMRLRR